MTRCQPQGAQIEVEQGHRDVENTIGERGKAFQVFACDAAVPGFHVDIQFSRMGQLPITAAFGGQADLPRWEFSLPQGCGGLLGLNRKSVEAYLAHLPLRIQVEVSWLPDEVAALHPELVRAFG